MNSRCNRRNKAAFLNFFGVLRTGTKIGVRALCKSLAAV